MNIRVMASENAFLLGSTYAGAALIVFGAELFTLLHTMDLTRRNHRMWMITIYLFLIAGFLYLKPSIAFGREGRIRPFGATDREATVFPLWWWVFVISVVAYCATVYLAGFRFTS
jgi:hypothetical protein